MSDENEETEVYATADPPPLARCAPAGDHARAEAVASRFSARRAALRLWDRVERAVWGLVLLPLVVIPLGAQYAPHLASEVACRAGRPYVADEDSLDAARYGVSRSETLRHEAVHLRQLARACDSTLAVWAADPTARLEAEVEATCVGFTAIPSTAERARRQQQAMGTIFAVYGHFLSPELGPPFGVIYAAFGRWCTP